MLTRQKQRGQAMAEYFVVAGIVLVALTTEVTISGKTDTIVNLALQAMQSEHAGFLYAVGQPPQPQN